jgi:hypothetical protein
MNFLSKLFDLMFPPTCPPDSDSDASSGSSVGGIDDNFFRHEFMAVNPANGMPMMGGIAGVDVAGNLWGQSDTFNNHGHYSSVDHSSDSFDNSLMFDSGSMFD